MGGGGLLEYQKYWEVSENFKNTTQIKENVDILGCVFVCVFCEFKVPIWRVNLGKNHFDMQFEEIVIIQGSF